MIYLGYNCRERAKQQKSDTTKADPPPLLTFPANKELRKKGSQPTSHKSDFFVQSVNPGTSKEINGKALKGPIIWWVKLKT